MARLLPARNAIAVCVFEDQARNEMGQGLAGLGRKDTPFRRLSRSAGACRREQVELPWFAASIVMVARQPQQFPQPEFSRIDGGRKEGFLTGTLRGGLPFIKPSLPLPGMFQR
jgi:hypothetical protein